MQHPVTDSPLLLAIDCTGPVLALALSAMSAKPAPVGLSRAMARGHAEAIMPAVATLLRTARADLAAITAIAVATGPGSYSGIRVGIAAARGLALARMIPVKGWSTLEILAHHAHDTGGKGRILALLPSRGDACFYELFDHGGRSLGPPACADPGTIIARCAGAIDLIAGNVPSGLSAVLAGIPHIAPPTDEGLAMTLAGLATAGWHRSGARPATPLYLREVDARLAGGQSLPVTSDVKA